MSLLFLLFLAHVAPAQTADPAPSPCVEAVGKVRKALEAAESPASNGQLVACFPAPGKSAVDSSTAGVKKLEASFSATYADYLGLRKPLDQVGTAAAGGGGNICGASDEVKKTVRDASAAVGANESADQELLVTLKKKQDEFKSSFGSSEPKAPLFHPGLCKTSKDTVALVLKLFEAANATCRDEHQTRYGKVSDTVDQLNGALKRGCKAVTGQCYMRQKGDVQDVGRGEAALYLVWYGDAEGTRVDYGSDLKEQADAIRLWRKCRSENGLKQAGD